MDLSQVYVIRVYVMAVRDLLKGTQASWTWFPTWFFSPRELIKEDQTRRLPLPPFCCNGLQRNPIWGPDA